MAVAKPAVCASFHQLITFVPSGGHSSQQNEKKKANKCDRSQNLDRLGKETKAFYEDLFSESNDKSLDSSTLKKVKQAPSTAGKRAVERISNRAKRVHSAKPSEAKNNQPGRGEAFFSSQTLDRNHRQHFKLLQCVQQGNSEEVQGLLMSGLDVNFQDFYGWTPLMCAANEGHVDVVKVLLEAGAVKCLQNSTGDNASSLARNAGFSKVVELIRDFEERQRLEVENSQKSSSSVEEQVFYCEMCKQHFCVREKKSHFSSTVHLFNSGKKSSGPAFLIPETNRGFQMLLRSGWTGESGLGPEGKGSKYPVKTFLKQDRRGLGGDHECKKKAKITHFNAKDERAVQMKSLPKREISVRTLAKKAQKLKEKREKRWEKNLRYEFI